MLAGLAGIGACAGGALARAATPEPAATRAMAMLGGPGAYARERRLATERRQPLVLFFSLAGCAYCEALRRDQLRHVHARREQLGVRVVELRLDDARPIAGVEPPRSPRDIASALQVRIAPTVLFLDGGREIAERLVGYASPDFYGAYLDDRIAQARAAAARGLAR